ncbi:hypothetical protein VitviT2T_009678 [Vitis vinifera]|uniref:Werner Syndrome-like exonuclease n=2 Tax=Vitis vinifera TaxID=29760 RepID=A0ABY9C6G3_VITVI|nr:uncharacterized protein LOC104879844 [Vitis vinifera]RVX01509.1 hypothetical protein CK203_017460 [Vitis vinifera]WJZ90541.1 hypothetical protein VitviT2T_009678 [Vitis vinifera]|eukprot:XP_010652543.1 PREDICTED: uncharacterized protein LOC104879844 [Vitis vinifera]
MLRITAKKDVVDDRRYVYHAYKVFVEDLKNERTHRIFTISTFCDFTAAKWFKEVLKSCRNSHGKIVVGVCAEVEADWLKNVACSDPGDDPYGILQLCIGSQCLIYQLPEPGDDPPRCVTEFFSDPNVVAVGVGMKTLAKRMLREQRLKMVNTVDLGTLAFEGLRREDLDLGRYDLDRLAKAVLGKHMDVVRPEKDMKWYDRISHYDWYDRVLTCEKAAYATVDPYLCFLIGTQLYDMIKDHSAPKKKKKNNKNKNKKN